MKIYYHNDLDGELSAFWILNTLPHKEAKTQVECIKCDYGRNLADLSKVEKNEEVWMVDYSIKPERFLNLLKITHNITWIDHHISSIEAFKDFPHKIKGLRLVGKAACELTWNYLNKGKVPLFTKWIGDFDVQSKLYKESTEFYYGCLTEDSLPMSTFWDHLVASNSFVEKVLENGKIILRYRDTQNRRLQQYAGFEAKFEGRTCACLNHCAGNSANFDLNFYDIGILFAYNGTSYNVSLYTKRADIDVAKLAEKYGGGGHAAAAGFRVKDLSFLIPIK